MCLFNIIIIHCSISY